MTSFNSLLKRKSLSKNTFSFTSIISAGILLLLSGKSNAQSYSLTTMGTAYTQNFDGLSSTGATNTLAIAGWYMLEIGTNANLTYAADNGGGTGGNTYSYGTTASTDRAFGGLRSGSLVPFIGASFTNNTGSTINSLDISYIGEEWRLGASARVDQLNFQYSTNATDITGGTWISVSALDFLTPASTATVGSKDGNLAVNRSALSSTITSLSILNGTTFWIRWTDFDASGADDGLAIDDFSLTPHSSPEMDIQGNGISISSGGTVTSVTNDTDFGNQTTCAGKISKIFTILNTGSAALNLSGSPIVTLSGANASDFSVTAQPSSSIAASGSSTFAVAFDPSAIGTHSATISITNDDADENPYNFVIQGTGTDFTVALVTQTNVSCFGGNDGAISVSVIGGTAPFLYDWNPGTPVGDGTLTATALTAGTWTFEVLDNNLCFISQTFTITQPNALVTTTAVTNVLCHGGTGSVTLTTSGGTSPYTYLWSTGATASVVTAVAGIHSATVTDAHNCSITATVNITEPNVLTTSTTVTIPLCNGGTGSATLTTSGGTAPYAYLWSTGATTSVVAALTGVHSATITDDNNCSITSTVNITEPSVLTATTSQTTISCFGANNGAAMANATGGTGTLSYSWIPSGGTSANASGLSMGIYTVNINDINNCAITKTVNITEPSALTASTSQTNISCFGGNNGATIVNATGGTGTLSYSWTPSGGATANESGLSMGIYTVNIKDANDCSTSQTVNITQPLAALTLSASTSNTVVCSGYSVTLTSSASGGTGTYNYLWNTSATTSVTNVMPTINTTYTVSVTDANNCFQEVVITVNVNALPTVSIVTSQTLLCNGQMASLTASGASDYVWNTSSTNTIIAVSPTVTTNYTVTGTDNSTGCSNSAVITQSVSICTGIDQLPSVSSELLVYPNPGKGEYIIDIQKESRVIIYDILGKPIYNEQLQEGKQQINLDHEPNGLYILQIISNGKQQTVRLLKQS